MNKLVEDQIKCQLEMQRDLFLDGEIPPSLKDKAYIKGMYIDCEEMSEPLAEALTNDLVDYVNEFAECYKYNVLCIKTCDDYTKAVVHDLNGNPCLTLCWPKEDLNGMNVAMMGLANKYPKLIHL